jgi:hypothetical protein
MDDRTLLERAAKAALIALEHARDHAYGGDPLPPSYWECVNAIASLTDALNAAALASQQAATPKSAEQALADQGVYKGHHGLRGLAEAQEFWDRQPYGTRLYYGNGGADYLHRGVLQSAVAALDAKPSAQQAAVAAPEGWRLVPVEPTEAMVDSAVEHTPKFHHGDPWYGTEQLSESQVIACYRAMLSASPVPDAQPKVEKTDLLDMEYINSLPHPFLGKLRGREWWPIHDFEVETGLVRIDVCGKLEVRRIADFTTFRDGHGVERSSDAFYSDANEAERLPTPPPASRAEGEGGDGVALPSNDQQEQPR